MINFNQSLKRLSSIQMENYQDFIYFLQINNILEKAVILNDKNYLSLKKKIKKYGMVEFI